jgi:hypothetical protein
LNQSPPGVDARDIFLRLETLKASATKPELEPEEEELTTEEAEPEVLGLSLPPPALPTAPKPELSANSSDSEVSIQSPPKSPTPQPVDTKPSLTVPEQLWLLLDFVESHFKETVEELRRLQSDGYMSFKLLWAICAPGTIVEAKDAMTDFPTGMRVESWSYGNE